MAPAQRTSPLPATDVPSTPAPALHSPRAAYNSPGSGVFAVSTEPDWTPGNNVQCFDRLDRVPQRKIHPGSTKAVTSKQAHF
jgi:hypothetical protein